MKLICIGDSITYGQNVRADEAWPAVLARLTGHDVRNAGACGDTTRLGLERFPKDVQLHKPDVVVIQFGHNDANWYETDQGPRVSASAYAANLAEMAARALSAGAAPILLLPHDALGKDKSYNLRLAGWRAGVTWPAINPPEVSLLDDGYGLHPDPAMHERYAESVAAAL